MSAQELNALASSTGRQGLVSSSIRRRALNLNVNVAGERTYFWSTAEVLTNARKKKRRAHREKAE
jgi:hypothetical protein